LERKKLSSGKYFAFNIWDSPSATTIIKKCFENNRLPFIQIPASIYSNLDVEEIVYNVRRLSAMRNTRTIMQLDHCRDFSIIIDAISKGFDSVMFDGSNLSLSDNIMKTREISDYAHFKGVMVEGEIGNIVGIEGDIEVRDMICTDLEDILLFVKESKVDIAAIGVGTQHGISAVGYSEIKFDLIERFDSILQVPVAIHGSSGLSDEILQKLLRYRSICKLNISTELRKAYFEGIREQLEAISKDDLNYNIKSLLDNANKELEEVISQKLGLLKCFSTN
jgi:ketose-bisphosphate aldolase